MIALIIPHYDSDVLTPAQLSIHQIFFILNPIPEGIYGHNVIRICNWLRCMILGIHPSSISVLALECALNYMSEVDKLFGSWAKSTLLQYGQSHVILTFKIAIVPPTVIA